MNSPYTVFKAPMKTPEVSITFDRPDACRLFEVIGFALFMCKNFGHENGAVTPQQLERMQEIVYQKLTKGND